MTVDEAIERLLVDPVDPAALRALDAAVRSLAIGACRGCRDEADDVAQEVMLTMLERIHDGALRSDGSLVGLLKTMCRRTAIDRFRKRRDDRRVPSPGLGPGGDGRAAGAQPWESLRSAVDPAVLAIDPVRLLEKLAADALEHRRPQDRPHLQQAFAELKSRLFDPIPWSEVVARSEGIAAGAPVPVDAMRRAYKRQERLRDALAKSASRMWKEGRLDEAEHALARRLRDLLVYCHKSGRRTDPVE